MIVQAKRIILLLWIFCLIVPAVFSQPQTSRNNYTGAWETPESWLPTWAVPQNTINTGAIITINGYITLNGSLTFTSTGGNLIIDDTLVVQGDLALGSNNDLTINDNGILIIRGNFSFDNQTINTVNGNLIITGSVIKNGSVNQASIISNDNPVKVFIGGTIIPAELTDNKPNFPALNCSTPPTTPYPNSICSYGNMTDIKTDPINSFFCTTTIPTITASGPLTFCAGGSVTLTSSAGTGYLWSTGAFDPSITVTTSGNYTVKVTDATGCQSAASAATIVTVNALPTTPTTQVIGLTEFCTGGSMKLTSSAGTSYLWSNGATSQSITVTTPGSYAVKITNASACLSAASNPTVITVNGLPATPAIFAGDTTTFCAGGSVTLTSDEGTSYLWSNGATAQSINVTAAGSYTVQVTDGNGCQSAASAPTVVTVHALPLTPTITPGGSVTFCAGSSITLTSGAGTSYFWSNGATTPDISVNMAGSYTVQVTNASGCQSAASAVTIVTGNALPATPTITPDGPVTFCDGGSVTLTTGAGTGYQWSNAETTQNINVTTAGSYTVQVTDANGCQSATSAATVITVNALPATTTISASGTTTFCAGDSVTLTSGAGTSYLWSDGATTQSINVKMSGSYTVQVTNPIGCRSAASAPTIVTVNALPATPTITPDGPVTFCDGGSVNLTTDAGTTYLWSNAATSPGINVTTAGSYTVQVTEVNGCQSAASAPTIVIVNALPATPNITAGGAVTFCDGGSVNLTSGTGTSYLWSNAATSPGINVTTAGSYTVQVKDANGCQSEASVPIMVIVNALPVTPVISADGPVTFCAGGGVTLTSTTGTDYFWSNGATTPEINVTAAGSYTVQVTNAIGCKSAASVPTMVTVNALPVTPVITADGPVSLCAGASVTLTSGAGTGYLWSDGANTQSINVTAAGSYTAQVTDANGCQSEASAATVVTVNALPVTPTITVDGPVTFCDGGNVTLTSGAGTVYLWSNAATTQSINVTAAGSYTVQVTDANGCQSAASAAIVITVNALPLVNITSSSTSMCLSDQRVLTGSPSGGMFIVSGGPGTITGDRLSATGTGVITLYYTYTDLCTNKATQSIIVDEIVIAGAGSDHELVYVFETLMEAELSPSETGVWSLVSGSGNIVDINSPTTRVTGLSIGENIFSWKVRNGNCEGTDEIAIIVNDIVTPTVITPNEDGLNDELIFPGMTAFPGSTIIIYNRWGSEVYRSSDYKNDWNGKDNKNRDLEEDTYYYILKVSNGRILKGFIEIIR